MASYLHSNKSNNFYLAEEFWKQAIETNSKHFDTQVNFALFKWKTAQIDDQELLTSLKSVFLNKHKGRSLEGIIKIALGEKEEGLQILEQFNDEQKQNVVAFDPSENLRRKNARKNARDIFNEVNLHKDIFFQNKQIYLDDELNRVP